MPAVPEERTTTTGTAMVLVCPWCGAEFPVITMTEAALAARQDMQASRPQANRDQRRAFARAQRRFERGARRGR